MVLSDSDFMKLQPGDVLPEVIKQLSQEKINLYAESVGDFNPVHVDEAFASQTPFGGTIAHGMLILAYISEMMTLVFRESWLSGGKLSVRFKTPAHSRDTLTVTGKINSIVREDYSLSFNCGVGCCNQNQEIIVNGEAVVKTPLNK